MNCGLSRRSVLSGALAALAALRGRAADVPALVRLVVPGPAGGSLDVLARALAQPLGRLLEANVVVFNVPGATGQLAAAQVARARPDGHTLLLGTSATHAIAGSLFTHLPYRPAQDFAAVGRVCTSRLVVVAHPSSGVSTLAELIDAARAAPAPLAYGSWGTGSGGHLAMEAVRLQAGIRLTHVAYQGIAPMMRDLLGGQIPIAISDTAGAIAPLRDGRLVPLAVSGTTRLAALPQVATLAETEVPFITESWCALFAPVHTPGVVLARLEAALQAALTEPPVVQTLSTLVFEPGSMGREDFQRLWQADIVAWRRVVLTTGISVN